MTLPETPAHRWRPSPNFNGRQGVGRPDMLILHYTGMVTGAAAEDWLCDPASAVSSHYLVHEDGEIVQMVAETDRAWHAGAGSWRGQGDINSRSIGIEIVNPGHQHGYVDFDSRQIAAVIQLCKQCGSRWFIPPQFVLAHSDIAPARKEDPGEKFPWDKLFWAGVGHYCEPVTIQGGRFLAMGDEGEPVAAFQSLLAAYGYGVGVSAKFDETTRFCTLAFQRHFRQETIDGVADLSTIATLHRLLATLPDSPFGPVV